ncbi:MAG: tRNA (adenosine(37)-N6)-threonylcarbamoyltransferase complex dimerization subunit type 1 TsaB [Deltaproteobacteria bacterium]|nr:tRNA (adenosine(37)-N6)-threonylcarbamoyltransferase complex dimerization subunit type 1 TsaB [Deltaproteobacteria bacterium]MCW8893970.1 tRNA (adenosine(37)-N6)-threonylcarbamoyltransferase complex dimerization subunit type 1 TsaB [Deltaproteobacteria bacterium]
MMSSVEQVKILTLDSSSMTGSVALSCGSTLIAESLLNVRSTHSEKLLKQIDQLLDEAGWQLNDLDFFAAVTGPGSFTGLRIGIATIKGLAQVLSKPVVAISSLQSIAMNVPLSDMPICAFLDARKKEVYSQLFRWQDNVPAALGEAQVLPPETLLKKLEGKVVLVGNAVPLYRELIESTMGDRALIPAPGAHQLRASQAAWLALTSWSGGVFQEPSDMLPTYVRPSDAELNLIANQSTQNQG